MPKKLNIEGLKFGRLTPVKETSRRANGGGSIIWECRCDCGKLKLLSVAVLRGGNAKSCGCLVSAVGKSNYNWGGHGDISGSVWARIRRSTTNRGKNRVLEFKITIQQAWDLFLTQDRKCALSGVDLRFGTSGYDAASGTASLDRIDSSKGYTIDNIQWVHKDVNKAKQSKTDNEFIEMCERVVKHSRTKYE